MTNKGNGNSNGKGKSKGKGNSPVLLMEASRHD